MALTAASLELPRVEGGWRTVLLDPPWPYRQKLTGPRARGGAEKHYPSLTVEEILSLPVGEILALDSQVWLWTTNSHIHTALHCLEAWNLEYKTMFTWVKHHFGIGFWLRGQTEDCLLAVQGNPRGKLNGPHGATGSNRSTALFAKRLAHSQKPDAAYGLIESVSEEPRVELFAKRRREGWHMWGDQLAGPVQTVLARVAS